jgi:hypothetical protein
MRGNRWRRRLLVAAVVGATLPFVSTSAQGTVEDQRARLPPPAADCSDPVEGIWLSKKYYETQGIWYEFTLEIRRTAAGDKALKGEIRSHYWSGSAEEATPPSCTAEGLELLVKMPGTGTVEATPSGLRVFFGAQSFTLDRVVCGHLSGYSPDNFTGTIDATIQEFQSLNDDHGDAVNVPHVFRRVSCFGAPPPELPPVDPPKPSKPPRAASRGCSCSF